MSIKRCCYCWEAFDVSVGTCPCCGEPLSGENDEQALPRGSVLNNRYTVGAMRSRTSFHAVYEGFDGLKNAKVQIKEFFPIDMVFRKDGATSLYCADKADIYYGAVNDFILEQNIFRQIAPTGGIAAASDVFTYGAVVYSVTDRWADEDFGSVLGRESKPLPMRRVNSLLRGICRAVSELHALNIPYGGISPEDIVSTPSGWKLKPTSKGTEAALSARLSAGDDENAPPVTFAADAHDIAVLYYRLLTGRKWKKGRIGGQDQIKGANKRASAVLLRALADESDCNAGTVKKMMEACSGVNDASLTIATVFIGRDKTIPGWLPRAFIMLSAAFILAGVLLILTPLLENAFAGREPAATVSPTGIEPYISPEFSPEATPALTPEPTPEFSSEPTEELVPTPTKQPALRPTATPTGESTTDITATPTTKPAVTPTTEPTAEPTTEPTAEPTTEPTAAPAAAAAP